MLYLALVKGANLVAKKAENGFTIIELLIAIAVVAILVPTLIGFVTTLNRFNDRARDMAIVNALVENKVESLRSIGFSGITDGTTSFSSELPTTIGTPRTATYTVTTPNPGIRQVDISVSYDDHGIQQATTYRTYIGELGVGQY
jgi:prepilin-type N-terminal cleavage/methylation domain-containing protein